MGGTLMHRKPKITWGRISGGLGLIVAIFAIALFIVDYLDTKNETRFVKAQLENCKQKNQQFFSLLVAATSQSKFTYTDLTQYLSEGEAQDVVAKAALKVKINFPFNLETQFFPSGWMGDGEMGTTYLSFERVKQEVNGVEKVVVRISYRKGPKAWAGIYWQYPDGNWGEKLGKSLIGAGKISFKAKGKTGNEIVEFKSGGIRGQKYSDSFEKSLGDVSLSTLWKNYSIDLSSEDLTNVIGGFACIVPASNNQNEVIFYISDLQVNR